ncbi:uncharacterized protein LOC134217198 [Armigeres subalbatus]|uniref:uncharacterized protein LOC134217198 n=1 Tax=Armigeres subalbatus TaxID=124917 RepID=UPI002ED2F06E
MKTKVALLIFATLTTAIDGHLLCYYCEDCALTDPVIQPCDFTNPILTTVSPNSVNEITQFPDVALTTSSGGGNTINTNNPDNSGSVLTTPAVSVNTPGWNDGTVGSNNGGGIVLTTVWPGMGSWYPANKKLNSGKSMSPTALRPGKFNGKATSASAPACFVTEFIVNNRRVVRRGCAKQGRSSDGACGLQSEGKQQHCTLCSSSLCNNRN